MGSALRLRRHWSVIAIAVAASAVLAVLLAMRTTGAAFSGTSTNANNSWQVGTVALTDTSQYQRRLFNLLEDGPLESDRTVKKCIRLAYQGTLTDDIAVKLYAEPGAVTDALAYLEMTVEEGMSGRPASPNDCSTFTAERELVSDVRLDELVATHDGFDTGIGTWAPTAVGAMKAYRLTVTARDVPVGTFLTGQADLVWEARTT